MSSPTWQSDTPPPPHHRPSGVGWGLVVLRGVPILLVLISGLIIHQFIRLIEAPLNGTRRPISPAITQGVCRLCLRILGLRVHRSGRPLHGPGAVLTNHSSWLDILVLNAVQRITFVSKAEVAGWPGIGWLARATGTLFIARDRKDAANHVSHLRDRLAQNEQLLFFPEGTSSDNAQVLPFKTTLFAAFLAPELRHAKLQPVTIRYQAPPDRDPRYYGWWGGMDLGPHLLDVLAQRPQGSVQVVYHPPQQASDFQDRKAMARAMETQVRAGHATS